MLTCARRSAKLSGPSIAVAVVFVAYVIGWSYMTLVKVYALTATVGDLGIILQGTWDVTHSGLGGLLGYLTQQSALLIYAIFEPLGRREIEALVVFQSAWLGAGSLPLYGIARRTLKSGWAAFAVAAAYLIYFPMAGVNWFDVHRQALFPTLFLIAWYLWLRGGRWRWASAALMVFSATLRFGYEVYPLWVSVTLIAEGLWRRRTLRGLSPAIVTLALTVLLTLYDLGIFNVHVSGPSAAKAVASQLSSAISSTSTSYLRLSLNNLWQELSARVTAPGLIFNPHSPSVIVTTQLGVDILTVVLALSPLLFLPLVSWRWAPLLVPFLVLVFLSTYWGYHYPWFFRTQYPSVMLAAAWLGTVEAIASIGARLGRETALGLSIALLAANGAYAMLYQPYGPFNGRAGINYGLGSIIRASQSGGYAQLMEIISMVPKNTAAIALQDNEPELLPRPGGDALLGCYPNLSYVNYVVADLLEPQYLYLPTDTDVCSNNMLEVLNQALASGRFGLEAQSGLAYLLVRNYTGPPSVFRPLTKYIRAGELTPSPWSWHRGNYLELSSYSGPPTPLFFEPGPFVLGPGNYTVTYELMRYSGSFVINLVGYATCPLAVNSSINVNLFNVTVDPQDLPLGSWTNVTVSFSLPCFTSYTVITAESTNLSGSLLVRSLLIRQLSP